MTSIIESGVINYNISDHLPINLVTKKQRNKIVRKFMTGHTYLHYDKEIFGRVLASLDWTDFEASEDPDILCDCFCANVVNVLDRTCPIRTLQVVDHKPEWLTNELLAHMRQRDKAFMKARRTKRQADWDLAKNLRNRLCINIKSAKANTIKA